MAIAYVEHPITKAEKKAFNKDGFSVIDIRFKPEKLEKGDKEVSKPKKK